MTTCEYRSDLVLLCSSHRLLSAIMDSSPGTASAPESTCEQLRPPWPRDRACTAALHPGVRTDVSRSLQLLRLLAREGGAAISLQLLPARSTETCQTCDTHRAYDGQRTDVSALATDLVSDRCGRRHWGLPATSIDRDLSELEVRARIHTTDLGQNLHGTGVFGKGACYTRSWVIERLALSGRTQPGKHLTSVSRRMGCN